jgi:hypothetical protein
MIPIGILSSVTSSTSLLLDQYPNAAAAYSLRKLRTAYTGFCIQVGYGNPRVTLDVGFINGIVDTNAILNHVGAQGDSFVTKWYDQSGNSRDMTSNITTDPRIVIAFVLNLSNGKPAINFNPTTLQQYLFRNGIISGSIARTLIAVYQPSVVSGNIYGIFGQGSYAECFAWSVIGSSPNPSFLGDPYFDAQCASLGIGLTTQNTSMKIGSFFYDSTIGYLWKNNTQIQSAALTLNANTAQLFQIGTVGGGVGAGFLPLNGNISECILYLNNQLANANGINTNINSFYSIYTPPPSVSDPDAQAFVDRVYNAGGTLTSTEANAVNTLTISLKAAGIWTSMKAIYPMVGASAVACSQNLKSSSFTGTFSSGWTFTSTGVTPNGTSAFMNTNFNTSTNLVKTSAHLSLYVRNNSSVGTAYDLANASNGGMTIDSTYLITRYGGNFTYFGIADPSYTTGINVSLDSRGFWCGTRVINNQFIYKNGTQVAIGTSGSTNLANNNLYLGAANANGTASFFSDKQYAFSTIGDELNSTQNADFYTAVQAFQTSLSRQV